MVQRFSLGYHSTSLAKSEQRQHAVNYTFDRMEQNSKFEAWMNIFFDYL